MNLNYNKSKLPFIIFPKNNLKVLIDTGSTKSFIRPEIAQKYFKNSIKKDPFKIFTAHGTSVENFSTTIPCPKIFKENKLLKFYLFNFQNLFGIHNLKLLEANIILNKNLFLTPHSKTKILFYDVPNGNVNCMSVEPRCEKIKVKNIQNGNVIIPYTKISDLKIPECLTKEQNYEGVCTILNSSEKT